MILLVECEGPDQTARMRRLIWAFAIRVRKITFSHGTVHKLYTRSFELIIVLSAYPVSSSLFERPDIDS